VKLALVTDAWSPQINGVVTTLKTTSEQLRAFGHVVETMTPDQFRNWPCPTYPEIRLALGSGPRLRNRLDAFAPDAIHIATEGPLGVGARAYCRRRNLPYTTSFHTRFAEYVQVRTGLLLNAGYAYLRWFHNSGERMMVATPSLQQELKAKGFHNPVLWSRGVDTALFRPRDKHLFAGLPRPIMLYTGRVAVEKNVEAFLGLDLPGTKVVVGDGPQRAELEGKFPDARFLGYKLGEELACHMAAADVFVFPSHTDTFGLVMLEALASGVPVAAFPVQGPQDVILSDEVGCLDADLAHAIRTALTLQSSDCRDYALRYSWRDCAKLFESHLAPIQRPGSIRSVPV
jgi:glycosyltransferase involved in cell wall biosynthesis